MATLPAAGELPPLPSPANPWLDAEGRPTPEFMRFMMKLRRFLEDQRTFIEQEHP